MVGPRVFQRVLGVALLLCWLIPATGLARVNPMIDFLPWQGPDRQPLPFTSDEQVLDFLRTACVVSMKRLREGINRPFKVLLEQDSVQAHAVFQDVHSQKPKTEIKGSIRLDYRDDRIFEVAAYELSRILGLRIIPPAVWRKLDGKSGSL